MGGGNQQKSAMKRERNRAKSKKDGNMGGGAAGKAVRTGAALKQVVCAVCRTTFLPTQAKSQLDTHRESRHPDKTFEQCFPDYGAVAAEAAPAAAAKKK